MVVAANHLGDAHIEVVHHHAEVIRGAAVGAGDNQVVQLAVGNVDAAFYQVIPAGAAVQRHFKAHHRRHIGGDFRQRFAAFRPPAAVVPKMLATGFGFGAQGIQLFFTGVIVISMAASHQLLQHFGIAIETLGLVKRAFVVA